MEITINVVKTTETKDKPIDEKKALQNFDKKLKKLDTLNTKKQKLICTIEEVIKQIYITENELDDLLEIR